MKKRPILIDCDPGVDDALALLLARQIPDFDIRAVTSVAGNATIEHTTQNALKLCAFCALDAPVCRGAEKPMFKEPHTGALIHGEDGLGGAYLPPTDRTVSETPAWDMIYSQALKAQGELEIIALAPLTNLGLALTKYKDLPSKIKRIVLMGGAACCGNVTPAAEYNFFADPEAASMVMSSGISVVMCGLDVTLKAYFTAEDVKRLGALGSAQARFIADALQIALDFSLKHGLPGVCMHDPLALLYAADDSIYSARRAGVRIETQGRLSCGKSVTDLFSDKKFDTSNADVVIDVDRGAFCAQLVSYMARYTNE